MSKVLQFIIEVGGSPQGYSTHMSFITSKGALNLYVTDTLIRYEMPVTDKVISGELSDWVSADPESVAIHLGVDATYAVRGAVHGNWPLGTSGTSGSTPDFSDWPCDTCWLYNNTSCYFAKCRRAHICSKCRKMSQITKSFVVTRGKGKNTFFSQLNLKNRRQGDIDFEHMEKSTKIYLSFALPVA